jgi:Uma2 family endonuclease
MLAQPLKSTANPPISDADPALRSTYPKRFTVEDYHRLIQLGFLGENDSIQLIRGELIQMAARGTAHETCITRLLRVLPSLVGDRATLRCQSPITLAFDGEPEPDFSIVDNRPDDYANAHPTPQETMLVIEVSDSSLEYDQTVKLALYAEAEISHYWIFNVVDRCLEAYNQPSQITPGQFGYLNRRIVLATEAIAFPPVATDLFSLSAIFPAPPANP